MRLILDIAPGSVEWVDMIATRHRPILAIRRLLRRTSTYGSLIVGLLAVGAVLRWQNIGDTSLWLDELSQVTVARADGAEFLAGVRSHTAAAPLDYLGTKLMLGMPGSTTVWLALGAASTAASGSAPERLLSD